jgi:hypothetical protein
MINNNSNNNNHYHHNKSKNNYYKTNNNNYNKIEKNHMILNKIIYWNKKKINQSYLIKCPKVKILKSKLIKMIIKTNKMILKTNKIMIKISFKISY